MSTTAPMATSPIATSTVPMHAPLVGIRLHGARAGAAAGGRAQQLLDLVAREAQRAAAVQAVRDAAHAAQRAVEALPLQVQQRLDDVAAIAVELGLALAREIVGESLAKGLVDPTPTVVRCLRDCVHGARSTDVVVRLHPQDLAGVQSALQGGSARGLAEEVAAARFVADPSVPRGGVHAETGTGRLCYDPSEVLARICDEVRREATA